MSDCYLVEVAWLTPGRKGQSQRRGGIHHGRRVEASGEDVTTID